MRPYPSIIFLLLALNLNGQGSLHLQISDMSSGKPIANTHIDYDGKFYSCNNQGQAMLKAVEKDSIHISHIAYRDTSIFIGQAPKGILEIGLQRQSNPLAQVEISNKPYTVFASAKAHVCDFEFWGDSMLIITYEKEKMFRSAGQQSDELYTGCELLLISAYGNILLRKALPDLITGMYRDPLGQIFVLGQNHCSHVSTKEDGIDLEEIKAQTFRDKIEPLNASIGNRQFFDNQSWDYPEFSHLIKKENSDQTLTIRTIHDDFTMELFRAEYKYMDNRDKLSAIRMEAKTGIDKEIYGAYMSGFQHSLYYHEIYAPLFAKGDSILIFDHHNDLLFIHEWQGTAVDSLGIYYHRARRYKFSMQLIQDKKGEEFYALFHKNGRSFLRPVSLSSGKGGDFIEMFYPYPENIKVRGGRVYYIYRKTGSDKTRRLFVELFHKNNP